jgi:hypothetical protein
MSTDLLDFFAHNLRDKSVSIVEFAESSDYCNKPLYPRQRLLLKLIFLEELTPYEEDVLDEWIHNKSGEVMISPKIRERIQTLRDRGYSHFREVMLVGGRRSSKGHMTGLAVAKKVYDLINMDNPQDKYGIDRDKTIWITAIAASEDQAKRYQFADINGAITSCEALKPYWSKFLEKEISLMTPADMEKAEKLRIGSQFKSERDLASIRVKPSAANAATIRGEATMVLVMDEMAHMMEGVNSKSGADEILEAARPALDQFKEDALIFENSSPYTKVGKFYSNYLVAMDIDPDQEQVSKNILDYRMMGFQFPSWELYKDWDKDPERRFRNAIVLSPQVDEAMAMEEERNPEKFAVERRSKFAEVVDGFLDPNKVDNMFKPFDGRTLKTTLDRSGYGPGVLFKGHCDPSTTTANFGLAIGHVEYVTDEHEREIPHVFFDYIHAWIPADFPDHTINYLDVQDEILEKIVKFRPKDFTFDQFQSKGLIQWLRKESRKKGVDETAIREVVATEKLNFARADRFKTALNLGLIHAPADFPLLELAKNELKFLQQKGNRVVKQNVGPVTTKDIADCIMEVVDHLVGDFVNLEPYLSGGMAMGAMGGYSGRSVGAETPDAFAHFYTKKPPPMRVRSAKRIPKGTGYNKTRRPTL